MMEMFTCILALVTSKLLQKFQGTKCPGGGLSRRCPMMKRMFKNATDARLLCAPPETFRDGVNKEGAERESVLWEAQLPSQGQSDMFVHWLAAIHKYSCGFPGSCQNNTFT